jgi:ArsR family transcriptional regulator
MATISKEELARRLVEDPSLQVVNVLDPKQYHLGFIRGSKRIPLSELERRAGELDKSREVIVYCASYDCHASRNAAKKLEALGFCARAYEGGIKEWKEAGLPVEEQAHAA